MLKGIGIDIIEIERIREAVENFGNKFLKKVFTEKEINYCTRKKAFRYPELAVRFSAKEAYSKALGVGVKGFGRNNHGIRWTEIEVVNDAHGKPMLAHNGKLIENAHVSLSHSRDYAVATVYIEK